MKWWVGAGDEHKPSNLFAGTRRFPRRRPCNRQPVLYTHTHAWRHGMEEYSLDDGYIMHAIDWLTEVIKEKDVTYIRRRSWWSRRRCGWGKDGPCPRQSRISVTSGCRRSRREALYYVSLSLDLDLTRSWEGCYGDQSSSSSSSSSSFLYIYIHAYAVRVLHLQWWCVRFGYTIWTSGKVELTRPDN